MEIKLPRFLKIIFKICLTIIALLVLLLVISIRPVDRRPYKETNYYRTTIAEIDKLTNAVQATSGQLIAGAGKSSLTPPIGVPLAGFGDRKGALSTGVHDSLFVRVIVIETKEATPVCIIGYDVLLCPGVIARQIEQQLQERFQLDPEYILFTATHTHSGPGGWSDNWVEKQFAGSLHPAVIPMFIENTVQAVKQALAHRRPVTIQYGQVAAPRHIRNRLDKAGAVDDALCYLMIWNDNSIMASFITFSAHATTLSGRNMEFSGDYPGYLERKLEKELGGIAMFAAAGVGSHSYRASGEKFEKSRNLGEALADSILNNLPTQREEQALVHSIRIPVEMPRLQIRISDNWTIAPWLAGTIFHTEDRYLQFIRIGQMLLIGSPAEFSGELALNVKGDAEQHGFSATITSFNGCYLGYVTPSKYADKNSYETRLMSFFGPYTGDYLTDLMKTTISKL